MLKRNKIIANLRDTFRVLTYFYFPFKYNILVPLPEQSWRTFSASTSAARIKY